MSSLLTRAEQEISLPVARLLLLVRSASQLFELHTRRSLYDGLQRLQERFSISLGQVPRLPQECLLSYLADGLFGTGPARRAAPHPFSLTLKQLLLILNGSIQALPRSCRPRWVMR